MDRRRLFNLFAAIATMVVFGLTLGIMFPLLALVMEKRGLAPDMIGYNAAMQPIGILVAGFTVPRLARRVGPKNAVIIAALLIAAIVLVYPFVPVFWWWFVLRFAQGYAAATVFTVSEAWIVRYAAGPYRSRLMALYTSMMALSFGAGPAIISLTGTDGALPFAIGACLILFAAMPVFFFRDEPEEGGRDGESGGLRGFVRRAPLLLAAVALFGFIDAASLTFLPVYGVKRGLDEATAALILSAFIFGNVVLQFPVGWLADHVSKRLVMAGCAALTVLGMGLLPVCFNTWLLWPVLVIAGSASAGLYTVALAELGERFSGSDVMVGTAAFSIMWGAGAQAGALSAGWTMAAFGPDGFPYTMALAFAVYLLLLAGSTCRER